MPISEKTHPLCTILFAANIASRPYSGRSMYGEQCLGVEVDDLGEFLATVIAETTDEDREEVALAFQRMRTDSMGRGMIVYFPGVAFVDLDSGLDGRDGKTEEEIAAAEEQAMHETTCRCCELLSEIRAAKEDETLCSKERSDFIEDARGELSGLARCPRIEKAVQS